jgi:hypothetical protein
MQAAQREIAHDPGTGYPAADYQHFRLDGPGTGGYALMSDIWRHVSDSFLAIDSRPPRIHFLAAIDMD